MSASQQDYTQNYKQDYKQDYKIFDMHTHAFPDKVAAKAIALTSARADAPNYHDGSFESLLEFERAGGAAGFLLLPIATNTAMTVAVNDWVTEKIGEGVYAFGSIHPEFEDYEKELDRIKAMGLKGVKMHPEYQDFFADEEKVLPIYKAIFDRNLILYFHAGEDPGFLPPVKADVRRIARVCDLFPQGRIVAAHMGGYRQYEAVSQYLAGRENLWFDTSFAAERMEPAEAAALIRQHGVKRTLFGTDAPWAEFDAAKEALIRSGLNREELTAIFYDNAADLLDIK